VNKIKSISEKRILDYVKRYERLRIGQPLLIIDHDVIRENYRNFRKNFPRIQVYYAVKANSEKSIIRTLYKEGSSFDVASISEFDKVFHMLEGLKEEEIKEFIYDKVILANTMKDWHFLEHTEPYVPLMTFDNPDELEKIKKYCACAGVILRVKVPDNGSQVEMGRKFGVMPDEGIRLIRKARRMGLVVEGLSFHVGSQCTNFQNYLDALDMANHIFEKAKEKKLKIGRRDNKMKILDLGGGFPTRYNDSVPKLEELARTINLKIDELFPASKYELAAEPGRSMVGNSATLILTIIGRSRRDLGEGKERMRFYHVNDGFYQTLSGIPCDHCHYDFIPLRKKPKRGKIEDCIIAGQTCDSWDTITQYPIRLPGNLELDDLLIVENAGAYTTGSSSNFNGFPGAKIININQD
jgi:ornithine decarboxylase